MAGNNVRIEFICLANVERSPMACAIGQKWVAEQGLSDKIDTYSSGTNVDKKYLFGADTTLKILRRGSAAEGLADSVKSSITSLLGESSDDAVLGIYKDNFVLMRVMELLARQVLADLTPDGRKKRNDVLAEHGLAYARESRQTTTDDRSGLVLPMTEGLGRKVEAIYLNQGKGDVPVPIIHPLPIYSGVEGKYEGTLGAKMEVFREVFDTLTRAVPAALEKAVKKFNLH